MSIESNSNNDTPYYAYTAHCTFWTSGYKVMRLISGDYKYGIWECTFEHVWDLGDFHSHQDPRELPYGYKDCDVEILFLRVGYSAVGTDYMDFGNKNSFDCVYKYSEIDPSNPHPWLNTDIIIPIIVIGFVATAVGGFIVTQRLSNTLPKRFKPSR